MIKFSEKPVYLCCGPTDMRKSINGLMALVKEVFSLDPFSDALFVFCNRNRDRIKILEWDGDGFWSVFQEVGTRSPELACHRRRNHYES